MLIRMTVQTLALVAVLGVLLFGPAGTLDWVGAWVFLGIVTGFSLAIGVWLNRNNPGLLAERMTSPVRRNQEPWDRLLMSVALMGFAGWMSLMGWAAGRAGGAGIPPWGQLVGAILVAACFLGTALVFRENSFAAPVVRVQAERGHAVITTGPYAVVRHPMYACALLFLLGTPMLLGSIRGLVLAPLFLPVLAVRALGEERVLTRTLPGYPAYAERVRHRLVPGVW